MRAGETFTAFVRDVYEVCSQRVASVLRTCCAYARDVLRLTFVYEVVT